MGTKIIVAYDGTPHAEDAIALGRELAAALDAGIVLAHVYRDSVDAPRGRDDFLRRQSEALLEGAAAGASGGLERRAVGATTTARGLRELAAEEGALAIVFGSAYDGPAGHVHPGSAARRLLQNAASALALAPAGFRDRERRTLSRIAAAHDDAEGSARRAAGAISRGEQLVDETSADLLVIASREGAQPGAVMLGPSGQQALHAAVQPVLVLPAGVTVAPGEPLRVPALA
jgi:nucleotide-binding universal stress UspA family protein